MSQSTDQLEEEVKSLVKEFMHDYNENLVQSLVSALQYYFVTLNVYAGSSGEYCVFSDEFYNQFNVVKSMATAAASTCVDSRFKKCTADITGIMDEYSKLYAILANVADTKLSSTREAIELQLDKAKYVIHFLEECLSGKITDETF